MASSTTFVWFAVFFRILLIDHFSIAFVASSKKNKNKIGATIIANGSSPSLLVFADSRNIYRSTINSDISSSSARISSSSSVTSSNSNSNSNNNSNNNNNNNNNNSNKISYRTAVAEDVPAIAELLILSFDGNKKKPADENAVLMTTKNKNKNNSTSKQNKSSRIIDDIQESKTLFMWNSLEEENNDDKTLANNKKEEEKELPIEQERQLLETTLKQRMVEMSINKNKKISKDESLLSSSSQQFLPHSFLVATTTITTTSSSSIEIIIGFLEMGMLPSPIQIPMNNKINQKNRKKRVSARLELPYIANVAVDPSQRRRKIGSTLIKLGIKIAARWCGGYIVGGESGVSPLSSSVSSSPSSSFSSFPFLFLSVESDNNNALVFYDRLGFEKLEASSLKNKNKIYLGRGLE